MKFLALASFVILPPLFGLILIGLRLLIYGPSSLTAAFLVGVFLVTSIFGGYSWYVLIRKVRK